MTPLPAADALAAALAAVADEAILFTPDGRVLWAGPAATPWLDAHARADLWSWLHGADLARASAASASPSPGAGPWRCTSAIGDLSIQHLRVRDDLLLLASKAATPAYEALLAAGASRLDVEFERFLRYDRALAVLHVRLDGGPRSDAETRALATQLAQRLRGRLRVTDLVLPDGEDAVLAALSETGLDGAVLVAERLCDAIGRRPFHLRGGARCTVSVGVAIAEKDVDLAIDQVIARARGAARQARQDGGGRARVARANPDAPASASSVRG